MPVGEVLNIVQIGDVAIQQHAAPYPESRLRTKGKAEQMLDSYRILLPHNPTIPEVREYRIDAVIYASYQRSTSHLYHSLMRLLNRVTDIIGLEIIGVGNSNWMQPPVIQPNREYSMWYHNRGRITDLTPKTENAQSIELRIEMETYTFWHPLNPALWYAATRDLASPAVNQRVTFASDEISSLPRAEKFYDSHRPMSFQKKIYADTSFHYDPDYFLELTAQQDDDLPRTRYTSDWFTNNQDHTIIIDRERWNAAPLSIYLFKDLVAAGTTITIEIIHEADIWSRQTDTVTIDIAAVDTAVDDAGFTLVDTDILVVGDVDGFAFVVRAGTILTYVADAVTRTGGAWPGQLYPGTNEIHIDADGSTHAQHHIYRRL
jgi:hypothetical protein